jgi:hypothetical protein
MRRSALQAVQAAEKGLVRGLGAQVARRRTRAEVRALMAPPESAAQALERVRRQVRPGARRGWHGGCGLGQC